MRALIADLMTTIIALIGRIAQRLAPGSGLEDWAMAVAVGVTMAAIAAAGF